MKAGDVRPGDQLPPIHPLSDQKQKVLVTEISGPGAVKITTDQGEWDFWLSETIQFPRRPDGSIKNWTLKPEPTAYDLRIGDILPGPTGIPATMDPRKDPDWLEYTDEDITEIQTLLLPHSQRVHSIQKWGQRLLLITFARPERLSMIYQPTETVSFPTTRPVYNPRTRRISAENVNRSGSYRNRLTGNIASFAISAGRGKYPAVVKSYDPDGSGLMSPPRVQKKRGPGNPSPLKFEWNKWVLLRGPKHPNDPRESTRDERLKQ